MNPIPFITFTLSLSLTVMFASNAYAMRCGTHLISKGDLAIEVKRHCGEPDWIDRWFDEMVLGEETDFEQRIGNVNERWVYNLGPQQFMRFVTFHNGRVSGIETGDYGFVMPQTGLRCNVNSFSLGMPLLEVQAKCGEPDSQVRRFETVTRPVAPGSRQKSTVAVDEWIYNLGPQKFVRILTFYNGELINIETGPRGF